MTRRKDDVTPDLFGNFAPAPIVERFDRDSVRASRGAARIAQAISAAIKKSKHSREDIARLMSEDLGENITVAMLDQYSSTANERNNIPAHRLVALLRVTRDVRILNAMLDGTDVIAIHAKYEALLFREAAKEQIERLQRAADEANARWMASK